MRFVLLYSSLSLLATTAPVPQHFNPFGLFGAGGDRAIDESETPRASTINENLAKLGSGMLQGYANLFRGGTKTREQAPAPQVTQTYAHPAIPNLNMAVTQLASVVVGVKSYNGRDKGAVERIFRDSQYALESLNQAIEAIDKGPSFTISTATAFIVPMGALDLEIHGLFSVMKEKHDMIVQDNYNDLIWKFLQAATADAKIMQSVTANKLGPLAWMAKPIADEMVKTIASTEALFKPDGDVTVVVVDGQSAPTYQQPSNSSPQQGQGQAPWSNQPSTQTNIAGNPTSPNSPSGSPFQYPPYPYYPVTPPSNSSGSPPAWPYPLHPLPPPPGWYPPPPLNWPPPSTNSSAPGAPPYYPWPYYYPVPPPQQSGANGPQPSGAQSPYPYPYPYPYPPWSSPNSQSPPQSGPPRPVPVQETETSQKMSNNEAKLDDIPPAPPPKQS